MPRAKLALGIAIAALAASAARAGAWDLFHPAPAGQLRDMQSDRPDRTEGPFTVDAGHVQIEADLVGYSLGKADGLKAEALRLLPVNLKLGLTDHSDFEAIVETYSHQWVSTDDGTLLGEAQGFGDTTLRLKLNFCGATEADGVWASGLIPYIKFPTNQADLGDHAVEGGLVFPQDFRLPAGFELGAMLEFEFLEDPADPGSRLTALDSSASLSHALFSKDLDAFAEYYDQHSLADGAELEQSVDAGLTLGLGDNASVDGGINVGLPGGDSLDIFAGFSLRL